MGNFLQNLQNKPEHVRWRILYVALFVCMIIVVMLWVWTVKGYVFTKENVAEEKTSSSPFKVLKDSGALFYQDFLNGIDNIRIDTKGD